MARFGGVERRGSEDTDGPQSPATRRNTPASPSLCVQRVASAGWVHVPIRRQPQPPPVVVARDGAKPSIHDANTPNGEPYKYVQGGVQQVDHEHGARSSRTIRWRHLMARIVEP